MADLPKDVVVLDTTYPDLVIEQSILEPHGYTVSRQDGATPEDIEMAGTATVIITGSRARFDAEALDSIKSKAIVRAGIGVDTVDLAAAATRGIAVCNVPDYGTESVAQHTLALALAGMRRLGEADDMVRRGEWGFQSTRPMFLPGSSTAGVVGLGRIGRRVAELFDAVGFARIVGHDPFVTGTAIEQLSFESLLAEADVVALHIPGNQDGSPVLGADEIALMRPGSVLVNTARGTLIDAHALAAGLAVGKPRIAALDVFAVEPPDLKMFEHVEERLILSPHQAWYSEESQETLRRKSAEEALRILQHEPPNNLVTEAT